MSATRRDYGPISQKRGKVIPFPFFGLFKMSAKNYFFASSFFSAGFSAALSAAGAPSFAGSAGAAGAGSAGAAGAGGGGGGAGSSFLPHPPIVKDKAKSAIADNDTNLFRMISFTSFPVTHPSIYLGYLIFIT